MEQDEPQAGDLGADGLMGGYQRNKSHLNGIYNVLLEKQFSLLPLVSDRSKKKEVQLQKDILVSALVYNFIKFTF